MGRERVVVHDGTYGKKGPAGFQQRHFLAVLAFFGFFIVYGLRVNLSVAIVSMEKDLHW